MFKATILALLLTLSPAFAPAFAQSPMRMVLDWTPQGQQAPIVMAAEDGLFARVGIAAKVDGGAGSVDAITKVISGAYDLGLADIGSVMQFNARTQGPKVFAVFMYYDVAPLIVMTLKKANIRTPADLAGKTMAGPQAASSRIMMPLLASVNHFDAASIKWTDVTPQLRDTLFARGEYQAVPGQITDIAAMPQLGLQEADITIIRYSDFGVDIYGHAVITTPAYAAAHPDIIRASLKAIAAGLQTAIRDPARAVAAEKKRDPLTDVTIERARLDLSLANSILSPRVHANGLSDVLPDRLQRTIDLVSEAFHIPPADPAQLYSAAYLPDRATLQVPATIGSNP